MERGREGWEEREMEGGRNGEKDRSVDRCAHTRTYTHTHTHTHFTLPKAHTMLLNPMAVMLYRTSGSSARRTVFE